MTTNLEYLRIIAASPAFAEGKTTTKFVEYIDFAPHAGGFFPPTENECACHGLAKPPPLGQPLTCAGTFTCSSLVFSTAVKTPGSY